MSKPAFIFDGRNILDHDELRKIGFVVFAIGKPLDPVRRLQCPATAFTLPPLLPVCGDLQRVGA